MKNTATRLVLIGLLIIAGLYLLIDHGQHIAPYFPFVFLLGCLVMHLFMHGGRGGHRDGGSSEGNDADEHTHHA